MATGFDHRHQHHHFFHQKTIFLPMLCRLSIKDIKLTHRRDHPRLSGEPSSPKVSCMGHVKRNNRVTGFPSAAAAHHHKYSKLKKLFSSKTLLPRTASSISISAAAPPCSAATAGGGGGRSLRRLKMKRDGDECLKIVDVGELDPPLPVVKKAAPPCDEVNIWKRRFNGAALKDLQIEQICSRKNNCQLQTV